MTDDKPRCEWPGEDDLMLRYHDEEWGVPVREDVRWLEYIILDGFQAGLSWKTILHRREGFRKVFHAFDPERIARMTEEDMAAACTDARIIRNRLKVRAAVRNAACFIELAAKHGSFSDFIWSFTDGRVIDNARQRIDEIPARTDLSDRLSAALKQAGFTFVGSTICYAILQSGGVVNDHLVTCFRYDELRGG